MLAVFFAIADIDSREDVQIARNAAPVEGDELQQANETIARLQAQIAMLQGENDRLKEDAARAEAELQAAREVQGNARAILEEYREAVHRAGQYKPTSTRGEAVSPLLRCIERVWLLLQEK
jgi:septal ring factor EnvC (AmiA/AmiB activator)